MQFIDEYNQSKIKIKYKSNEQFANDANSVLILLIIVGVLSYVLVYLLTRNISKRLKQLVETNNENKINKNLTVNKVPEDCKDEIGLLASSSNVMVDTLNEIIGEMNTVSKKSWTAKVKIVKGSANEAKKC